MVTISRVVEQRIREHPFMQEALARGILNYAALAEQLQPDVERVMKGRVKESAIMMALRRLREHLRNKDAKTLHFGAGADVVVKSDLCEITVKKSERAFAAVEKMYALMKQEQDFLTVTQGLTQITLITNRRHKQKVLSLLDKEQVLEMIDHLASLSTTLPPKSTDESGFFYVITRAFAWEQIPLVEIVSTLTELSCIVREEHVPRAFIVLKDAIQQHR